MVKTNVKSAVMKRAKVGIILDSLGKLNTAPLRFALLKLNTLQTFVDFEIIYQLPDNSSFLESAKSGKILNRKVFVDHAEKFQNEIEIEIENTQKSNKPATVCDRYIAICNVSLDDNYYLITTNSKLRILAVGSWSSSFSPPSLLEFIVTNCAKEGARQAFAAPNSHRASRGCIFDFNDVLENTRNGILIGHICSDCEISLNASGDERWHELKSIMGGKWLGDPSNPYSTYAELNRLKFKAFQASGVENSWLQKFVGAVPAKLAEEIVKSLVLGISLFLGLYFGR